MHTNLKAITIPEKGSIGRILHKQSREIYQELKRKKTSPQTNLNNYT